ncbi:hypothetical protein QH639_19475 [Lysinibacillus sp. 1 U-2021]|uniref:hypothetical protein n=1 Tax=Lysinibacillus sp. 1 U-2021 TaxID=3039426 RepID=UPI0024803E48|nr:hypothetical protein [Lysinibacillus sp. 1 U-2021]WGT37985.1 hypothetical protein QH639_19475 [Lysinibacillus sp. 1 U-2021]
MNIDLDNVWGDPKYVSGVSIYPVLMKDIVEFYDASSCLLIPKNSMSDARLIKMTYLAFLIGVSLSEGNEHLYEKLIKLLQLVTRCEKIKITVNEKDKFIVNINEKYEMHERDFDKLREIISMQNLIETKNDSLGSDFDKAKDKAKSDLARRNSKMADLEQQIIAYKCVQKTTYEEIKNMTIYQFRKEIERIDLIKSADVLQSAQYSGMVSFKEGATVPHWLDYIKERNSDDDLILSKEQLDHISSKNGLVSN